MPAYKKAGRCLWLFLALVGMILGYPYFLQEELKGLVATSLILICSIRAVARDRFHLLVSSALGVSAVFCSAIAIQYTVRWIGMVGLLLLASFYTYIIVIVLRFAVRGRVTAEKLLAVLSAYMLVGFTFSALYRLVFLIEPGAFRMHGGEELDTIYFSFITLSTIGYGDTTAAVGPARSLAILEGVFGVFYVAVLVSRLVNLAGQLAEDDE